MQSSSSGLIISNLQEALNLCQPKDFLGFAARYMLDEKSPNPTIAHALHSLIFIIDTPEDFRSMACTIYCNKLSESTNSESSSKIYMEGSSMAELVEGLQLGSFWFPVKAVDELTAEKVMALRKVDFNTFVSLLRLPIACYQTQFWLRDELADFDSLNKKLIRKSNNNSGIKDIIQHYSVKWAADSTIDLMHFKQYLHKHKAQEVSSRKLYNSENMKSSLRLHGEWVEADVKLWTKVLVTVIENSLRCGVQASTVGFIINELVQSLMMS